MLLLVLFRLGNGEIVSTPICDLQAAVAPYCELHGVIAASNAVAAITASAITAQIACRTIHIPVTPAPIGYEAKAVYFDGTVLVTGSSFESDSPYGLISFWSKSDQQITFIDAPDTGNFAILFGQGGGGNILLNGTFYDVSNENYWNQQNAPYSHNCNQWTHVLLSWDMNHAAGERIFQAYISDVLVENDASGNVGDAFSVNLTGSQTFVFHDNSFFGGGIGNVADFYFDTSFLDLTIEANRRKFISATGKPVDLGANGETPTGSSPQIFFSGDAEEFLTNKGSGPSFTYTGVLTDAATSPSD